MPFYLPKHPLEKLLCAVMCCWMSTCRCLSRPSYHLICLLKIRLAQDAHNVDASARPLEHHAVIACPQTIEIVFEPLQLLDPFSVGNRIVDEGSAIGENLIRDLVRKGIEVSLRLL